MSKLIVISCFGVLSQCILVNAQFVPYTDLVTKSDQDFAKEYDSIHWLFEPDSTTGIKHLIAIHDWYERHHHTDYGLKIVASANRHYGQGFNTETENFDPYRISVGVEWDLLSGGWLENKSNSKIHHHESRILELSQLEVINQKTYGARYARIIYLFNKEKIKYLRHYEQILYRKMKALNTYYIQHLVKYDKLLELKKREQKFNQAIQDFETYNIQFEKTYGMQWASKNASLLVPMSVSLTEMMSSDFSWNQQSKIRYLENEVIKLKNRNRSNIKFSLYARTNVTNGQIGGVDGNYNTIGARLSVPISSFYHHSNTLSDLEIVAKEKEYRSEHKERKKEILVLFYEYEHRLQQYQNLHYDRLMLEEDLRQTDVKMRLDSTRSSKIKRSRVFQAYMDLGYEMIGVRQILYLDLLRIQQLMPEVNIAEYCEPIEFQNSHKLQGQRIFQISSQEIQELGFDFVVDYLINQEVRHIYPIDLDDLHAKKLKALGFSLIESIPNGFLKVMVNEFQSRLAIEAFINYQVPKDTLILFDSISDLVQLEIQTIQMNQP